MNEIQLASIERKNAWLHDLVEVEFPTPESLKGRDIYFQMLEQQQYQVVDKNALLAGEVDCKTKELFLVDFHRLTIMFSILQSQRWDKQYDQEMIVEYLTQIILTPDFELYVGFKDGNPVGAAIVSQFEGNTLISDVAVSDLIAKSQFESDLAKRLDTEEKLSETIIIEC
ncbi:flavodoxin [Vibrio sp. J1-1]|uniref:flavodoxin n=1 Tax=Vibrio sp. J1-1 TaxID=2912251 RepID=UPI001F3B9F55|nr:flavodoxin [Vibrio sp. J1-1]MBR9876204.1 flavodoxin [Vibrionaceae bacterium]MCF7483506.1 flavodoxin [Vibrio sp. J1-1]